SPADGPAPGEAGGGMAPRGALQAGGTQLDFPHDRVREVVGSRVLPHRRQLLHRAVAEALEAAGPSSEAIEQLAHHALHGDLPDRAVRYLRQAGSRAAARSALADARAWFERALGCLETLPQTAFALEAGVDIRLELQNVLGQLGELQAVVARLQEAAALAERLDDDARRGRVHAFLAHIQGRLEDPDQAIASGERALEIAERLRDTNL